MLSDLVCPDTDRGLQRLIKGGCNPVVAFTRAPPILAPTYTAREPFFPAGYMGTVWFEPQRKRPPTLASAVRKIDAPVASSLRSLGLIASSSASATAPAPVETTAPAVEPAGA